MPTYRVEDIEDIEVIISSRTKVVGTPTVFDLEEMLKVLRSKHPVDVYFLRKSLKWLMKRAYKDMNVVCKNPWWTPRKIR